MLKVIFIGNLGQDAEVKEVNGKFAVKFSVAINEKFMKQGVQVDKTTWINCTLWRDKADRLKIAEYLKRGTQVFIEAKPDIKAYNNKDGEAHIDFSANVINLELLGSSKAANGNTHETAERAPSIPADTEDYNPPQDLPF